MRAVHVPVGELPDVVDIAATGLGDLLLYAGALWDADVQVRSWAHPAVPGLQFITISAGALSESNVLARPCLVVKFDEQRGIVSLELRDILFLGLLLVLEERQIALPGPKGV